MVYEHSHFDTLKEIGDLSSDGMVVYDLKENKFLYVNNTATRLTGIHEGDSRKDVEELLELVVPEDRNYLKSQFTHISKRSRVVEVEFRLKKGDDPLTYLCCNAYLVKNKTCIVISIQDISHPKQIENYLIDFGTKKNTLLEVLVHNISGALSLMQNLTTQAEKSIEINNVRNLKTYLDLVKDNSKYCVDIINDLLTNEHLQSLEISVKNSRMNVVDRVALVYKKYSDSYKLKKFKYLYSSPSIYANTDDVKLLQVVNNLTSNAIKFTEAEGEITIQITEGDGHVLISVIDNGIGIPEDLKPVVFKPRSAAARTALNGEKSMGLGLSICKKLIELMGGKIWFESEEGKGSAFHLSISKE